MIIVTNEYTGCPYCGTITASVCCGEMHHETLYEVEVDGEELSYLLTGDELISLEKKLTKPSIDTKRELLD